MNVTELFLRDEVHSFRLRCGRHSVRCLRHDNLSVAWAADIQLEDRSPLLHALPSRAGIRSAALMATRFNHAPRPRRRPASAGLSWSRGRR